MSQTFWNLALLFPAFVSASLLGAVVARADSLGMNAVSEVQASVPSVQSSQTNASRFLSDVRSLESISGSETSSGNPSPRTQVAGDLGQVNSISQLSDVQPTDWAFQALQSLVERYGCIAGYPDGTYKGSRALTRYEFAAGLNACLDRISELIATSTADLATQEDLATLQRLQEEFAAELATLRGRVDSLEARTAQLEAHQFSTTTKLSGDAYFTVADVFGDDVDSLNNTVLQYRYRANFNTSFTGRDLLRARLQAGNVQPFTQPGNEVRLAGSANTNNSIVLDDLSYQFPVGDRLQIGIVANAVGLDSLVFGNTINSLDLGSARGSFTQFGQRPPIYRIANTDAGAAFNYQFNKVLSLQLAYSGGEPSSTLPGAGLFNGNYGLIGQLTARNLFGHLDLGFTYVNSYTGLATNASGSLISGARTGTGSLLSAVSANRPVSVNSYGIAANFKLSKGLQIGGWVNLFDVRAIGLGDADVWNYALTLSLPDLGKEGNLGGIVVGVEPRLTGSSPGLGSVLGRRSDPDTGLHVEAFYRIALNSHVDITPGILWLTAPNHDNDNADIFFGVIRTTFRF